MQAVEARQQCILRAPCVHACTQVGTADVHGLVDMLPAIAFADLEAESKYFTEANLLKVSGQHDCVMLCVKKMQCLMCGV
jgi:hypothetical protein